MNIVRQRKERFDGIINISSDIRKNKRTLIGKFDVKDLIFIGLAIIVWVILSVIFILIASEDLIPIYTIFLFVTIIPIMYIGFKKKIDMEMLDYILMKSKSKNRNFRTQIDIDKRIRKDKYVISLELINGYKVSDEDFVNDKVAELRQIIDIYNIQVVYCDNLYLNLEVALDENFCIVPIYNYLKHSKDIKIRNIEDIISFDEKNFIMIGKPKNKRKMINVTNIEDEVKTTKRVYKILQYMDKVNFEFIDKLRKLAIVIKYIDGEDYNTFILISGSDDEVIEKEKDVYKLSNEYYIVIEELLEKSHIENAISISLNSRY